MREKLFILWGDLEERKVKEEGVAAATATDAGGVSEKGSDDAPSVTLNGKQGPKNKGNTNEEQRTPMAKPFSCCIAEYGVKGQNGQKERRFSICKTTIV